MGCYLTTRGTYLLKFVEVLSPKPKLELPTCLIPINPNYWALGEKPLSFILSPSSELLAQSKVSFGPLATRPLKHNLS